MHDTKHKNWLRYLFMPQLIIIAAPHASAGYANDAWERTAIGWSGREP